MDVIKDNQEERDNENQSKIIMEPIESSSKSIATKSSNNSEIGKNVSTPLNVVSSIISKNIEPFNTEVNLENEEVIEVEENPSNSIDEDLFYNGLQKIVDIIRDAELLRQQVENFSGSSTDDRDYIYLEEMLIRSTIRLDNIDLGADEDAKQERKKAIRYIQKLMKILDARLKENQKSIKHNKSYESDDD